VLHSFAHTWSRGDKYVRGEWIGPVVGSNDSGDTVQAVEVQLPDDCDITPIAYGQQLYKKADKLGRARVFAQSRLNEAMLEVDWLEGMVVSLDMARSFDDIAELEAELALEFAESVSDSRVGSKRGKNATKVVKLNKVKSKASGRRAPKTRVTNQSDGRSSSPTETPSGVLVFKRGSLEVLVGRNARGNETVTFDIAKKGDAWLHAAGTAGAHVIVRQGDGSNLAIDAEEETIEFAADLAAYFSKSSQSANVPVSVLRAAEIRRAPGSPRRLGSVILSRAAQTVNAKPLRVQEAALAALSLKR
jgi:predicted ribosome quality control (RQC) complex YloA/Tae2 family protein